MIDEKVPMTEKSIVVVQESMRLFAVWSVAKYADDIVRGPVFLEAFTHPCAAIEFGQRAFNKSQVLQPHLENRIHVLGRPGLCWLCGEERDPATGECERDGIFGVKKGSGEHEMPEDLKNMLRELFEPKKDDDEKGGE